MGAGREEPTLLVPTEPHLGLEEAQTEALPPGPRPRAPMGRVVRLEGCYTDAVTGFWPIFFLLVVLKIPVLGAIWLVWWAASDA